jgi:hypothetical protein
MNSFYLHQVISEPNRITENCESLIDVICLSNSLSCTHGGTLDIIGCTDHVLVFCGLLIKNAEVSSAKYFYRNIKNIDMGSFAFDALHNIPWSHTGHIDSIDDKVNFLNECIITLFDLHAPLQQFNLKKNCTITFHVEIVHMKKSFWASS